MVHVPDFAGNRMSHCPYCTTICADPTPAMQKFLSASWKNCQAQSKEKSKTGTAEADRAVLP